MGAIGNMLGVERNSPKGTNTWITGTHGLPSGEYALPDLLEPRFFSMDQSIGPHYGWTARNVTSAPKQLIIGGIPDKIVVLSWCYSSMSQPFPLVLWSRGDIVLQSSVDTPE
jgi:hypothetical protein